MQRLIVLDTETTGLDPKQGHRVIEVGCVELLDRQLTGNNFHEYLQPDREIDQEAIEVHGITNQFLADKPRFGEIVEDLVEYLRGAELVIHNAAFDVGFLNHEIAKTQPALGKIENFCTVTDTLLMARKLYPGQRNNLDALCKRLGVDNSGRDLHGALLDAEILGDVYLAMTGGQVSMTLESESRREAGGEAGISRIQAPLAARLPLVQPAADELAAHEDCLALVRQSAGECLWDKLA